MKSQSTAVRPLSDAQRYYGLDIIKIAAMFLVTLLHLTEKGGALGSAETFPLKAAFCLIYSVSFASINLFALSTGFLCFGKKNRLSRLLGLWLQVLFWSLACDLIIPLCCDGISFSAEQTILHALAVSYKTYWYFSSYVVLFFFMPLLNAAVEKLTEKQFAVFSVAVLFFFGVIPFIFERDPFESLYGYSTIWLIFLYIIGAGIKKFELVGKFSTVKLLAVFLVFALISCVFGMLTVTEKMPFPRFNFRRVYDSYSSLPVMLMSSALFLMLAKIRIKNNAVRKAVRLFAGASFSVYLIQCNKTVWNNFLVKRFGFIGEYPFFKAVLSLVGIAAGAYIALSVLGIIQAKLFKLCRIDKLCNKLEELCRKLFNYVYQLLNSGGKK